MNAPKTIEQRKPAVASSDLLGESGQTKYVVGFMFDVAMSNVALIRKNKPAWQAGLLNGIGGKVEAGEEAINAMCREFGEEAGLWPSDWTHFCSMSGTNNDGGSFEVEFFYTIGEPHKLTSMESEQIEVVSSKAIAGGEEKTIGNLPWLVALALDFGKGVHPPSKVSALYSPNGLHERPGATTRKDTNAK
jgi:8-oxo-dGTP diphosphatase